MDELHSIEILRDGAFFENSAARLTNAAHAAPLDRA